MYYAEMPIWQDDNDQTDQRTSINAWLGYNHSLRIEEGELYDMKNLTGDFYPLLSPRKPRSVMARIASDEWDDMTVTMAGTGYGDVSQAYVIYQSGDIAVDGIHTLHLGYNFNSLVLDSVQAVVTFKDEDHTKISEAAVDNAITGGILITTPSDDTAYVSIKITATFGDPTDFDPDDIDTYVYDWDLKQKNEHIRGITTRDGRVCYFIREALYVWDDTTHAYTSYDMEAYMPDWDDRESRQQLVNYGAYILIFPLGLYFNTLDPTDKGNLAASHSYVGTVNYTLCDLEGNAYSATASATAPDSPSDGDYWLNTANHSLNIWYDALSMWSPVPTTYIKIQVGSDDLSAFSVGEAVFMNTKYPLINNGSIIMNAGEHYIIVTGIMDTATSTETFTSSTPFEMERLVPQMDYVCVSQNRVWGCYRGPDGEGGVANAIYACQQGNPKNWYAYEGLASDSYSMTIPSDGNWTGAITFNGYPMFFKENVFYKIYGSYPSAYQLYTYDCRGVQEGSDRSIVIVGEYLLYKSVADVCVFDGSVPVSISRKLGPGIFRHAAAGASLNKYYISMQDEAGRFHVFIYDMEKNMWYKDEDLEIEAFAYTNSGQLYGQSGLEIYGYGIATNDMDLTPIETEPYVEWYAETGDLGFETPDFKRLSRITMRASIPVRSELRIEISYDDGPWLEAATLRGYGRPGTQSFTAKPVRCDHFRLRLSGHGDVKVYTLTKTYEAESEETF